MTDERHIVITLTDAKIIADLLMRPWSLPQGLHRLRIVARFVAETGADMREIVELLQNQPTCAACTIEGQAHTCQSLNSQKLGRRLRRLLERAA